MTCPPRLLIAAVLFVGLLGCGSNESNRVALTGTVTRVGQPIESGSLTLTPAAGQKGVAANAPISKGRYQFSREDGPTPGQYKALIQEILSKNEIMERNKLQKGSESAPTQWTKDVTVPDSKSASLDISVDDSGGGEK